MHISPLRQHRLPQKPQFCQGRGRRGRGLVLVVVVVVCGRGGAFDAQSSTPCRILVRGLVACGRENASCINQPSSMAYLQRRAGRQRLPQRAPGCRMLLAAPRQPAPCPLTNMSDLTLMHSPPQSARPSGHSPLGPAGGPEGAGEDGWGEAGTGLGDCWDEGEGLGLGLGLGLGDGDGLAGAGLGAAPGGGAAMPSCR